MAKGIDKTGIGLIERIADGSIGDVKLDKGGNWSEQHGVWVDRSFQQFVAGLSSGERTMIDTFASVSLTVAQVFNRQVADAEQGLMWPDVVFEEGGADLVSELIELEVDADTILGLSDPYSTFGLSGFERRALPYSKAYHGKLESLITQLQVLSGFHEAEAYEEYLTALLAALERRPEKVSDFEDMRKADIAWVGIPSDATLLFMAEPTEVYLDPARVALGQDSRIAQWANQVEKSQGLSPWRTFFEFRLLVKDESMVTENEVMAIRRASRKLFSSPNEREVPVSLEFRRLLVASGNGANPAKNAKNYPNQLDIRREFGYKNILYTNMIEMETNDHIIPSLTAAWGEQLVEGLGVKRLIRGSVLLVVSHEENHPFRRLADVPMEEMKSTVNGIVALSRSGLGRDDINSAILTSIGHGLHIRSMVTKARAKGDGVTERKYEAYHRQYTMVMNALWDNRALLIGESGRLEGVDYDAAIDVFVDLAEELNAAQSGNVAETVPQFHEKYSDESVWDNFVFLE